MRIENLLERFKKLDESYYSIKIPKDIFIDCCRERCNDFIKQHFEKGSKKEMLEVPFLEQLELYGKHCHTTSLYLLGLLGESYLSEQLKKGLSQLIKIEDWYDFKYTWFLTCLYHDIASCIEKTKNLSDIQNIYFDLCDYLKRYDLKYTPYNYHPMKDNVCLTRFPESLVKKYFLFRGKNNSVDHGIIGGYLLFDRFCKNFKRKTIDDDWDRSDVQWHDGLQWRKEHIDHSAYIADAIICHNIWLSYEAEKDKSYKEQGLNLLIVSETNEKLEFNKYPLQFILCLLDTIEPIKRFEDLQPQEVLLNIGIEFFNNGLIIEWGNKLELQPQFKRWINGIIEMEEWMEVYITINNLNRVTIAFNKNKGQVNGGRAELKTNYR